MSRVAVLQTCSTDNIEENIASVVSYIEQASANQAAAVFLPECCCLMQTSRQQLRQGAELLDDGPIQSALSAAAKGNKIWVFAGSIPLKSDDPARVFNTSLVYNDQGHRVARYNKVHLFDVELDNGEKYLESAYTMPGNEIVAIDSALGMVGLSVCYDLRFPELYRALADRKAQILLVPSAFSPTTGAAHWQPLLQARAIENFCYVIAAAQTGKHPSGRKTYGHSIVIDPWGKVIAELEQEVGLIYAELELSVVDHARKQMPSLLHRRMVEFSS